MRQDGIASTGYVLHTLHASIWCLLTTRSFRECVLKAVNLGDDTDTTGCVAGGLAGVAYGLKSIQSDWLDALARGTDVKCLFEEFLALRCWQPTENRMTSSPYQLSINLETAVQIAAKERKEHKDKRLEFAFGASSVHPRGEG